MPVVSTIFLRKEREKYKEREINYIYLFINVIIFSAHTYAYTHIREGNTLPTVDKLAMSERSSDV